MINVMLHDQYRAMPGIGFLVIEVEAKPTYDNPKVKTDMETKVTSAARSTCDIADSWKAIPLATAYMDFYRAMGLNPNRVSTPFRQAFRFTKKSYRSVNPLVDLAMYAEYGSGVSFQVMSPAAIGDNLCFRPTSSDDYFKSADGRIETPKDGEIGTFSNDRLIHAPSIGLSSEALWKAADRHAIVRAMCPPGLGIDRLEDALRRLNAAPCGLKINTLSEWRYPHD